MKFSCRHKSVATAVGMAATSEEVTAGRRMRTSLPVQALFYIIIWG